MWENQMGVLDGPESSPNLNPIEKLWIIIKNFLNYDGLYNK